MIYFIYGNNRKNVFAKSRELVKTMRTKKPDASVVEVSERTWAPGILNQAIGGQGLFENRYIVIVDRVLDNKEIKEEIMSSLSEMKDSDNVFIWHEYEISPSDLKKIERASEKVQKCIEEFAERDHFNIFSLGDLLGKRDKKNLWVAYRDALSRGVPVEEIHGTLFWQIKNIILAKNISNAKDAGMKPFPYSKAKKYAGNFSEKKVVEISEDMVFSLHESRRGKTELETALEKILLSI